MHGNYIYNSRNYYRLLNYEGKNKTIDIYNSRNYYRLLNIQFKVFVGQSTTVEITIGYLTRPNERRLQNLQQ